MTGPAGSVDAIASLAASSTDPLFAGIYAALAIAVVDDAGRIHRWSPGCVALYGWSAEEAIGQIKHDLLRSSLPMRAVPWPPTADVSVRKVEETHRDGHVVGVVEQVVVLDGTGYHALCMMRDPAVADGPDVAGRHTDDAQDHVFDGETRDRAMAAFAAHLRHELSQPLSAASNFLAVAQHRTADPASQADLVRYIDLALDQIDRVGAIIRNTHQRAAGEDIAPQSVAVRTAIEDTITLVRAAGGKVAIHVPIDVDVAADVGTMFVDPVAIRQVLANLLRNAIEAFGAVPRAGARIQVAARRSPERFVLSIRDNGPGIAPEAMAGLFEPFGPRDKEGGMGQGLGLGLSICRTLIEAHRGTLSAENLPGGGACFTVSLPPDERDDAR